MIEQQACPLCKKKFNSYIHCHLRNKHRLSAKELRPYMKITRSAVKHKDTVLNKIDIIVTEFEEQNSSLDNDFKDIEDLIVTLIFEDKTVFTQHNMGICIRETIRSHLFPLYRMVRECLDKKMYESMVQRDSDAAPQEAKRVKIEEVSNPDGGQDTMVNESSINE